MNRHSHEWPLVAFSSLATVGAGILAAWPIAWASGWPTEPRAASAWALGLLVAGIAISLAHLGRPLRAALVLRRFGRSPLSTEVGLAVTASVAAALIVGLPAAGREGAWLIGVAFAFGVALLAWLGLVYRLPGTATWTGPAVVAPLLSGLLAGAAWHLSAGPRMRLTTVTWPVFALILADAALLAARWSRLGRARGLPRDERLFFDRHVVLLLRAALLDVIPAAFLLAAEPTYAFFSAAFGVLVERWAFYGLAISRTTESDVVEIETVIERG